MCGCERSEASLVSGKPGLWGIGLLLLNPDWSFSYKFSLIPQRIDRIGYSGFDGLVEHGQHGDNQN